MKFMCSLIVVDDIERSRSFYENVLGQRVKYDFGENIAFEAPFAIHLKSHYESLLGSKQAPILGRNHSLELYFESDSVDEMDELLEKSGVEFIHGIMEQPWGQRVMRFYDPDGHIVEVGETMEAVVRRFHGQGMSANEIATRTSMPLEFVNGSLGF